MFGLQLSTFAQLILAGVIPWLLAAAALPLETIIRNSVFILSIFASFALIFLAFICKTISAVFKNVGVFVLAIYDFDHLHPVVHPETDAAGAKRYVGRAGRAAPERAATEGQAGALHRGR